MNPPLTQQPGINDQQINNQVLKPLNGSKLPNLMSAATDAAGLATQQRQMDSAAMNGQQNVQHLG